MKVRYLTIIKAIVISIILLFAAVFIFTHFPRTMEFIVTVYKYEKDEDGDDLPKFDKPIEAVCSLRKWDNWFSGDIFQGTVELDGRIYVTPEDVRWYNFRNRDRVVGLVCETSDPYARWDGYMEYNEDFNYIYINLDEMVYIGGVGYQYEQGEHLQYTSESLPEEIAAYLAP